MANHKKHRPISARGHCKMCKYWKINGYRTERLGGERFGDYKRRMFAKRDANEPVDQLERSLS